MLSRLIKDEACEHTSFQTILCKLCLNLDQSYWKESQKCVCLSVCLSVVLYTTSG